jgi:hypothetical protein
VAVGGHHTRAQNGTSFRSWSREASAAWARSPPATAGQCSGCAGYWNDGPCALCALCAPNNPVSLDSG